MDAKRIAMDLRKMADELDPPMLTPLPDSGDPWARAGMKFDTIEARIVAASKFDHYLTDAVDWRRNRTVPLESAEWPALTAVLYGSSEGYITHAMSTLGVTREALGRWMRAAIEHRGYPIPGWWAQWFATEPA